MRHQTHMRREKEGFSSSFRPLAALVAGARFLTNIQETSFFFRVTDAVDGPQNEKNYQRFLRTEVGARLDTEKVDFADVLADREMLERQADGSLARAYLDFMAAEKLDMDLLTQAEAQANASTLSLDPSRRLYMLNGIVLHDLLHVVTGYGRDAVGEACLLTFTAEQFSLRGIGLMAHAVALREQAAHPRTPVLAMLGEAKRIAREAGWIAETDWRDYLPRPVEAAREALLLHAPRLYLKHLRPSAPIHDNAPPHASIRRAA